MSLSSYGPLTLELFTTSSSGDDKLVGKFDDLHKAKAQRGGQQLAIYPMVSFDYTSTAELTECCDYAAPRAAAGRALSLGSVGQLLCTLLTLLMPTPHSRERSATEEERGAALLVDVCGACLWHASDVARFLAGTSMTTVEVTGRCHVSHAPTAALLRLTSSDVARFLTDAACGDGGDHGKDGAQWAQAVLKASAVPRLLDAVTSVLWTNGKDRATLGAAHTAGTTLDSCTTERGAAALLRGRAALVPQLCSTVEALQGLVTAAPAILRTQEDDTAQLSANAAREAQFPSVLLLAPTLSSAPAPPTHAGAAAAPTGPLRRAGPYCGGSHGDDMSYEGPPQLRCGWISHCHDGCQGSELTATGAERGGSDLSDIYHEQKTDPTQTAFWTCDECQNQKCCTGLCADCHRCEDCGHGEFEGGTERGSPWTLIPPELREQGEETPILWSCMDPTLPFPLPSYGPLTRSCATQRSRPGWLLLRRLPAAQLLRCRSRVHTCQGLRRRRRRPVHSGRRRRRRRRRRASRMIINSSSCAHRISRIEQQQQRPSRISRLPSRSLRAWPRRRPRRL